VKLAVVDRPRSEPTVTNEWVRITLQRTKVPALPKGLPPLPATPAVCGEIDRANCWHKLAELLTDPKDALIVEGYLIRDPELPGIAVYATMVPTKKLEAAKRQAGRAGRCRFSDQVSRTRQTCMERRRGWGGAYATCATYASNAILTK
jgi:hypothetical protein